MKHLLYFSGYRMTVLRWHKNAFAVSESFEPDEKGLAAFESLIRAEFDRPVRMLVDILEEDFRVDSAPHVYGRDRKAVHRRLLNKFFRQYEHKSIRVQGRQHKGRRRDDVVLLSALTNSDLFKPWLNILKRNRIALEGLYSLPLVGESLIRALGGEPPVNMLVVSQQVPGNIRQSFYVRGALKLSRLAPGSDDEQSHYQVLSEETDRTLRYLENQMLTQDSEPLEVFIVAAPDEHPHLAQVFHTDSRKRFHLVNRDSLARAIGIQAAPPDRYCSWLYAHMLLRDRRIKPHYGTPDDRRYFYHHQVRQGLYGMAAAAFSLALIWSAYLMAQAYFYARQQQQTLADTERYRQAYQAIVADISDLDLKVEDIRDAVDVADRLTGRPRHMPYDFMQLLSKALSNHPRVSIRKLEWIYTDDEGHSFGEARPALDERTLRLLRRGRKTFHYEKARVEAVVTDYNDNPRVAVETVSRFAESLRQTADDLDTVEVIEMPFDVDPASRMVGEGISPYQRGKQAGFAFVMVRRKEGQ